MPLHIRVLADPVHVQQQPYLLRWSDCADPILATNDARGTWSYCGDEIFPDSEFRVRWRYTTFSAIMLKRAWNSDITVGDILTRKTSFGRVRRHRSFDLRDKFIPHHHSMFSCLVRRITIIKQIQSINAKIAEILLKLQPSSCGFE